MRFSKFLTIVPKRLNRKEKKTAFAGLNLFHIISLIVTLVLINSCALRIQIQKLSVVTDEEQINFIASVISSKVFFKDVVIPNLGKFDEECKRFKIVDHYSISDDSIINMEIACPDLESANNLMTSITDIIEKSTKTTNHLFRYSFNKIDSQILFRLNFKNDAFKDNGTLLFNSIKSGIFVPEKNNNGHTEIIALTDKQVIFSIYDPNPLDSSVIDIKIYFPRKTQNIDNRVNDVNVKIGPKLSVENTQHPRGISGRISDFFEEHMWARISAVLSSIVCVVTLYTSLFKKKQPDTSVKSKGEK